MRRSGIARGVAVVIALTGATMTPLPARAQATAPSDPAAAKEWKDVLDLLQKQVDALNEADRTLASFIASSKLTAAGKKVTSAASTKIDAARTQLQSTFDAAKLLSARPQSTVDDAARFRNTNLAAISEAGAAAEAGRKAAADSTLVDHSEEERADAARKAAEATTARKAAADAARATEEQRRKDAEDARKSEEQRRKDAEDARKAAAVSAAAAAEAKVKADADAKASQLAQLLKEQSDRSREVSALFSGFLMKTNLSSDSRNAAIRGQKQLDALSQGRMGLQVRLDAVKEKSPAQASKLLAAMAAETERATKDLARLADEQKSLASSPKSYFGGTPLGPTAPESKVAAAAPEPTRRLEDIVPMCEFTFEPADGKPMQLAIDGGPLHALPSRTRLASGRHVLIVKRDKATEERRELLLCGRIATVPLDPVK